MKSLTPDIYIVDGNITLFLGAHSEQYKKDILYPSLLGQLLADSTPDTWLFSYRDTLGKLFWTLVKTKDNRHPKAPASLLSTASNALIDELGTEQLLQLEEALSTVSRLSSDSPASEAILKRIQREKPPTQDGNPTFNVSTLLTVICENKKVLSVHISFETSRAVDITFLEQPLSEKFILGDIETSFWTTKLSESNYVSIRNVVIEKLGDRVQTQLLHIPAPNSPS